eukprot:4488380-Prorocentrum_lima.AAC.1
MSPRSTPTWACRQLGMRRSESCKESLLSPYSTDKGDDADCRSSFPRSRCTTRRRRTSLGVPFG